MEYLTKENKNEKKSTRSKIKTAILEMAMNTTFQGVQNIARTEIDYCK